jgi:hypothetical protein
MKERAAITPKNTHAALPWDRQHTTTTATTTPPPPTNIENTISNKQQRRTQQRIQCILDQKLNTSGFKHGGWVGGRGWCVPSGRTGEAGALHFLMIPSLMPNTSHYHHINKFTLTINHN